jgi:hypothetical protein
MGIHDDGVVNRICRFDGLNGERMLALTLRMVVR